MMVETLMSGTQGEKAHIIYKEGKATVTLKIVILTFCYEYELIITHNSSFCKSNISVLHVKP